MKILGWPQGLNHHIWLDGDYHELLAMLFSAQSFIEGMGHRCDNTQLTAIRGPYRDEYGNMGRALYRVKIYCSSPDPLMMIKLAGGVPG